MAHGEEVDWNGQSDIPDGPVGGAVPRGRRRPARALGAQPDDQAGGADFTTAELAVHAWDLAQAVDPGRALDPRRGRAALAAMRQGLTPENRGRGLRPGGGGRRRRVGPGPAGRLGGPHPALDTGDALGPGGIGAWSFGATSSHDVRAVTRAGRGGEFLRRGPAGPPRRRRRSCRGGRTAAAGRPGRRRAMPAAARRSGTSGGQRHGHDRRVAGRQADAVAEGVGEGQVVGVDAVDPDLEQQVERGHVADPAAPGRREVVAAGVLGQPQRRPVDGVPARAAGVPAGRERRAPRRRGRARPRRSRCRAGRAATCSRWRRRSRRRGPRAGASRRPG